MKLLTASKKRRKSTKKKKKGGVKVLKTKIPLFLCIPTWISLTETSSAYVPLSKLGERYAVYKLKKKFSILH